jgi:hypothetical protein
VTFMRLDLSACFTDNYETLLEECRQCLQYRIGIASDY